MCPHFCYRLVLLLSGSAVAACGGAITLPDDGSPASLRAVSGSGQEGTIRQELEAPLIVRVTDANSQPVQGVAVEFQFQTEDPEAQVDPTEAATNSDGLASAEVRLGAITGTHIIEARVAQASAAELRDLFALTAVAPGNGKKDKPGKGGREWGPGQGDDDDDDDDHDDDD